MSRLEEKQKVMRVGVERASRMHRAPTSFAHKQLLPKLNIDPFSPLPPARLDPPLLLLRYQYGIIKREKRKNTHTYSSFAESATGKTQGKKESNKTRAIN